MRRIGRFAMVGIGAITLSPASSLHAQGQAQLTGRITDTTGTPIARVELWAEDFRLYAYSDSSGRYALTLPLARSATVLAVLHVRSHGRFTVHDTVLLASERVTRDYVLRSMPPIRLRLSRTDSVRVAHGDPLPACLPEDFDAGLLLWMFRETVSAGRRGPDSINRAISGLPWMDTAAAARRVTQVQSGPLCDLAVRAYEKLWQDPDSLRHVPPRRVLLLRVDSLFLVNDPTVHCGEWTPVITFDSTWVALFSALR